MQPAEIRQWLRSEIEESEKALQDLEFRRNEIAKRLDALRVIESDPVEGENVVVKREGSAFHLRAAATLLKYGAINVPIAFNDIIGEGRGSMTVDGQDYRIGISRKQNRNGRPRINGGVELKALVKSEYKMGELLEVRVDEPGRLSLFRVADRGDTGTTENPGASATPGEMF